MEGVFKPVIKPNILTYLVCFNYALSPTSQQGIESTFIHASTELFWEFYTEITAPVYAFINQQLRFKYPNFDKILAITPLLNIS